VDNGKIVYPLCIFKTNCHGFFILLPRSPGELKIPLAHLRAIGLTTTATTSVFVQILLGWIYRLPKLPGSVDDESTYTGNVQNMAKLFCLNCGQQWKSMARKWASGIFSSPGSDMVRAASIAALFSVALRRYTPALLCYELLLKLLQRPRRTRWGAIGTIMFPAHSS
jgi:hypothetical protein